MIKLPERLKSMSLNTELKNYAIGWNITITNVELWHNKYDDECIKEQLLKDKEFVLTRLGRKVPLPFFEGRYDCLVEIERLNEGTKK